MKLKAYISLLEGTLEQKGDIELLMSKYPSNSSETEVHRVRFASIVEESGHEALVMYPERGELDWDSIPLMNIEDNTVVKAHSLRIMAKVVESGIDIEQFADISDTAAMLAICKTAQSMVSMMLINAIKQGVDPRVIAAALTNDPVAIEQFNNLVDDEDCNCDECDEDGCKSRLKPKDNPTERYIG